MVYNRAGNSSSTSYQSTSIMTWSKILFNFKNFIQVKRCNTIQKEQRSRNLETFRKSGTQLSEKHFSKRICIKYIIAFDLLPSSRKLKAAFRPRIEDLLYTDYDILMIKNILSVSNKTWLKQISQLTCKLQFCVVGTRYEKSIDVCS